MVFAAKTLKLAFIVNVVLDENKKVIRAYAGNFDQAHREGCRFVDKLSGVDAIPADIVISTNCGGHLQSGRSDHHGRRVRTGSRRSVSL